MSLRDDALDYLRSVFGRERREREKAESPSAEAEKHLPSSIFSVWGREDIGGLLSVSQNLMDRYADYEQMDDYPDINCLAGDTKVYVVDGSITKSVTIHDLATEGGSYKIIAFDRDKAKLTLVDAENPRLTSNEGTIGTLKFSNAETIRCTPEHKYLHRDRGWIEAQALKKGDPIVSVYQGFSLNGMSAFLHHKTSHVTVEEVWTEVGKGRVYDITTKTLNFVANGVVVHNSANHYFTNDATQPDIDTGRTVWVHSSDDAIKGIAENLLRKKLKIEDEIWSMAYTLVKYGNSYEECLVTENGLVGTNFLPVPTMRRVEQANGALIGYVQDVTGKFTQDAADLRGMLAGQQKIPDHVALFEDWQVLHMRLRGTARRCPYGYAVSDGARWIWKRLVLLEDAMLIYKLTRAPARFAFYIDVTDIPSDKVEGFLRKAKQDLKKTKMVNPRTQRLDMRFNPMSNDEDFFIAVREGRELGRVEILQGPDYQATEDVEYFAKKLHGVLKVPRSYLGQEDAVPGKSILSNEDVRAARVTMGIQREIRNGIHRLIQIDLAAKGIDPFKTDVQVLMTVPSGIYELAAIEVKNARADYASRIMPLGFSKHYIQQHIFKLSEDEVNLMEKQVQREAQMEPQPGGDKGAGGDVKLDSSGALGGPAGPPPSVASEPAPGEMGRPSNAAEWKKFDQGRRIEEDRDKKTRQNIQEIQDKLGLLLANDRQFAARFARQQAFFSEFRQAVFARTGNGAVHAAPIGRGNGSRNGRIH